MWYQYCAEKNNNLFHLSPYVKQKPPENQSGWRFETIKRYSVVILYIHQPSNPWLERFVHPYLGRRFQGFRHPNVRIPNINTYDTVKSKIIQPKFSAGLKSVRGHMFYRVIPTKHFHWDLSGFRLLVPK